MDSAVFRIVSLLEKSEYLKAIPDKEVFAEKLIQVYNFDIGNEIKKMDLWLYGNENRRKKNYKRFIINWLNRKGCHYE